MNWFVIVVILLIALCMVRGYKTGFLRVLYSLVEMVLILAFVSVASPHVADFILTQTPVPDYIESACRKSIAQTQQEKLSGVSGKELGEKLSGVSDIDLGEKLDALGISIPDNLAEKIFDSTDLSVDSVLSTNGLTTEELLERSGIYDRISEKVTTLAVNGIAYVLTFIVAVVIFQVLGHALGLINKIPLLGTTNQVLGFAAGFVQGILIIWIFFGIVAVIAGTGLGARLTACIAESPVLVWLYQNNLLVTVLLAFL